MVMTLFGTRPDLTTQELTSGLVACAERETIHHGRKQGLARESSVFGWCDKNRNLMMRKGAVLPQGKCP